MKNLRLFFAIDLPENIKQKLLETANQDNSADWRLVNPNNLHITISFLGEINQEFLQDIIQAGQEAIPIFSPISIKINNVSHGPIGQNKQKDMIWANIAPNPILEKLKNTLNEKLMENRISFKNDFKKFNPHITLARLQGAKTPESEFHRDFKREFTAQEMILMSSELTPRGHQYIPLQKFLFENKD